MTKSELRGQIAQRVKNLSPVYCREADEAICRHLLRSPLYQKAEAVLCYMGTAREIDTSAIVRAALDDGKRLALPLCTGKGVMEAREIRSLGELVSGKYGILAPMLSCPVIEPEQLDLVVVPCCTGNARGQRLGYGGGYYDRYLTRTECPRVLLCRGRLTEEDIPLEAHDLTMDYLVTEAGMTACQPVLCR